MLKRKDIEKRLKEVVEELNKYELPTDLYLILVGGASLILKYDLKRSTHDIDVAVRPYIGGVGDILAKKGFQVVAEAFLNLPPDYEERLEKVIEKGKVHILTLSPYDLAVSKISRGLKKDIEDVLNSFLKMNSAKGTEKSTVKRLYKRAKELVARHSLERRERFLPYYYLLAKEMGEDVPEDKFRFALAVATYVLENALWWTEQDEELYEFLKYVVGKYGKVDYREYVESSPLPLKDYIEANYDFRNKNK